MKVMQVITRNELRGAETFATTLSAGLLRRGHSVCIPAIYSADSPAFAIAGAEHVELGGSRKGKLEWRALSNLRACLKKNAPQVIQANGFHALKYAVLASQLQPRRCPIVYRNISLAGNWVRGSLQRQWGRWLFRNVAWATSVSQQCAADLCQTYGYPAGQTSVIHRGIAVPPQIDAKAGKAMLLTELSCRAVGAAQTIRPSTRLLMHIGGFTPEKNQVGLLDALQAIRDQGVDVHLVLCGEGPTLESVRSRAKQLRLCQHVSFLGSRTDAAQLVAGADLFVLPSHVEGIPGVVLEAAAQAVTSVCTRVGGIEEAVLDGTTGVLIPAGDMRQMATSVVSLLNDNARRINMGAAAREHVAERFGLERAVEEFELVYQRLTRSR